MQKQKVNEIRSQSKNKSMDINLYLKKRVEKQISIYKDISLLAQIVKREQEKDKLIAKLIQTQLIIKRCQDTLQQNGSKEKRKNKKSLEQQFLCSDDD